MPVFPCPISTFLHSIGFDDLEVCKFLVDELGPSGSHHDGEKFKKKNSKKLKPIAKLKKKKLTSNPFTYGSVLEELSNERKCDRKIL